jgi:hypothetical protein
LRLFFLRAQVPEHAHTCLFPITLDSKADSKTGRQQWISVDGGGNSIGLWSGWKTLCDFAHFPAASELIILPQKAPFKHEVGSEKKEILRPLPPYHCREFKKEALACREL